MKILLLNPHIDAQHKILKALQADKHALLVPENAAEAWQMAKLHGQSLDIAIIHREGDKHATQDPDVGAKLIEQLKKDPSQADLPIILSSEIWKDAEFVRHQETPSGVNAYLHWPFSETELRETLQAVFGPVPTEQSSAASIEFTPELTPAVVLETTHEPTESTSISLEAPWVPDEPAAAPLAPPEPVLEFNGELSEIQGLEALPQELPTTVRQAAPIPEPVAEPEFEAEPQPEPPAARTSTASPLPWHPRPVGDALVPGGASQSPDTETLKKYLLLREQDVATLSSQLRSAREQLATLSSALEQEQLKNSELITEATQHHRAVEDARKAGEAERDSLRKEVEELRFEMKMKMDKARLLESQVREATQEMDRLKERVRSDIRKIRVREKELENRLEIVRSDSEVLVSSRESKIVELKRKLDLLEFNMDLLQDRFAKERENSAKLKERLAKAAQVVRVVGGVLDTPSAPAANEADGQDDEEKREAS